MKIKDKAKLGLLVVLIASVGVVIGLSFNLANKSAEISDLRGRNAQLKDNIAGLGEEIDALEEQLKAAHEYVLAPSPVLPNAAELGENWTGYWKFVTADQEILDGLGLLEPVEGFVMASRGEYFQIVEPFRSL